MGPSKLKNFEVAKSVGQVRPNSFKVYHLQLLYLAFVSSNVYDKSYPLVTGKPLRSHMEQEHCLMQSLLMHMRSFLMIAFLNAPKGFAKNQKYNTNNF